MSLVWRPAAIQDRGAILDYIWADNRRAAIELDDLLEQQVEGLIDFPLSGRPGRVNGTRELIITGTPFIVAYRVLPGTIEILRVLHSAQQWPDEIG